MTRTSHRSRRRAGFTLIELLLVLGILVVLGAMAVQIFGGTQTKAYRQAAKSQVDFFNKQAYVYQANTKQFPSSIEDFIKAPSGMDEADWAGPYIDGSSVPKDPWDNEYKMTAPGKNNPNSLDIWSIGPDGQDGTDDDIGNWES
ncbi:type II secretion system protein GspG [Aeoliella sp.]|uniref:type II secretion system protein GspG n=1 Tax=Aeoliella sp. TaxID=2795800 RepID=UPI003CCBEDA4